MYVLSNLGKPFAIVESNIDGRIESAILDEFSFEGVCLLLDEDFKMPDWGNSKYILYSAFVEDEVEQETGSILITKLVKY